MLKITSKVEGDEHPDDVAHYHISLQSKTKGSLMGLNTGAKEGKVLAYNPDGL
jgi:hypothetical protein